MTTLSTLDWFASHVVEGILVVLILCLFLVVLEGFRFFRVRLAECEEAHVIRDQDDLEFVGLMGEWIGYENARSVGRREVDKAIHSRAKEMAERLEQIKNRKKSLADGWRSDRRAGRMARQNNWFVRLIGGKA